MDISELDRTQTYGNKDKCRVAVVRYKDNGRLSQVTFECEGFSSLGSTPPDNRDAKELHTKYMEFAREDVLKRKGCGDTEECFNHGKWIEAFFMRHLGGGWTYDTLPTLADCERYEANGVGGCLPKFGDFIIRIPEEKREEMLAKCGVMGCRIDNEVYRLRRDAETGEAFLLREDFAILCNRRKRDEIKGVAKEEKPPNWMTDTEDGADAAWVEEYGRTHGTTARKDAAQTPVREQLELF